MASYEEFVQHFQGKYGDKCIKDNCAFCHGENSVGAMVVTDRSGVMHPMLCDKDPRSISPHERVTIIEAYSIIHGLDATTHFLTGPNNIKVVGAGKMPVTSVHANGDKVYRYVTLRPVSMIDDRFRVTLFRPFNVEMIRFTQTDIVDFERGRDDLDVIDSGGVRTVFHDPDGAECIVNEDPMIYDYTITDAIDRGPSCNVKKVIAGVRHMHAEMIHMTEVQVGMYGRYGLMIYARSFRGTHSLARVNFSRVHMYASTYIIGGDVTPLMFACDVYRIIAQAYDDLDKANSRIGNSV